MSAPLAPAPALEVVDGVVLLGGACLATLLHDMGALHHVAGRSVTSRGQYTGVFACATAGYVAYTSPNRMLDGTFATALDAARARADALAERRLERKRARQRGDHGPPVDDEATITGERTWAERDAACRRAAVELD